MKRKRNGIIGGFAGCNSWQRQMGRGERHLKYNNRLAVIIPQGATRAMV